MKKILILLIFALFITQSYSQQFYDFNNGGVKEEHYFSVIPYNNVCGLIIVEAEINGKKYKFLVDTGSSAALSQNLFNELNIQNLDKVKCFDSNGKTDSLMVAVVPNIKLGDLNFYDTPALVIPPCEIFNCFKIDGIIGSNMLRNSIIRFSSKDQTLTISNTIQKLNFNDKKSTTIELTKGDSHPLIRIVAKNKKKVNEQLLFDSGMTDLYQISLNHFNFFNDRKIFKDLVQSTGVNDIGFLGSGKDTIIYFARVPEILINKIQFKNISIKTTSGVERIGAKLIDYGMVTVDFINKRFYFESFEQSYDLNHKEFPIDIMVENGKVLVGTVWDENLKDQVKRGDQIIKVDGLDYSNVEICDVLVNKNYFKLNDIVVLTIKSADGFEKIITMRKEI